MYIKKAYRGKGYGRKAFLAINEIAKELELVKITLTVNKYNFVAVCVYEKLVPLTKGLLHGILLGILCL